MRDGIDVALKNFGPILGYAVIASTVGVILKSINDRSKGFGRFITSLIGTAWNVATYLVVPILAVEGIGPIEAVKRSVELLKRTWGEQIVGNMGIGAITGIGFLFHFPDWRWGDLWGGLFRVGYRCDHCPLGLGGNRHGAACTG